jgi:hypothetical protein
MTYLVKYPEKATQMGRKAGLRYAVHSEHGGSRCLDLYQKMPTSAGAETNRQNIVKRRRGQ